MAARRSRMSGDFKLRKTLRNIHTQLDNELKPAMQEAADKLLATMKEFVPKDSGDGAAALTAFVSKSGLDAEIGLRGKKANKRFYYLRFIEYGTKGYAEGKRASGQAVATSAQPTNLMAPTFSVSTRRSRRAQLTPGCARLMT